MEEMVKRAHRRTYKPGVFKHYTVFEWCQCHMCGKDFRRERGFSLEVGLCHGGRGKWIYLCETCCPNREAANKYALGRDFVTGRSVPGGIYENIR